MLTGQRQAHLVAADTEHLEVGRRLVEVPIPADLCQAHLVAAGTEHLEAGRRVGGGSIPADLCQAYLVAADRERIEVGRRVVEVPIPADLCQARLVAADREEASPEADRIATLLMADTIIANDFHPVSPHTSLTVRRRQREPPALLEH